MPKVTTTITIEYEKGDIYNMTREEQKALILANLSPAVIHRMAVSDLFAWHLLLAKTEQAILLCDELLDVDGKLK